MKSDGIQRAVRANRHDRSTGDAPSLGRVARMPGTGMPKGERRRRRRSERAKVKGRRVMLNWSILFGIGAIAALLMAVYFWLKPQMDTEVDPNSIVRQDPEEAVRVKSKFPSPTEAAALEIVKRGLAVRDPSKVAESFHPGATSPEKIVEFLGSSVSTDGKISQFEWLSSMDANNLSIDGVLIRFTKDGRSRERIVFLTPDQKGVWKIDFDAYARTVAPSWSELLENGAEKALVRVLIAPDVYYNGPFRNDAEWTCYGMASPDQDQVLLGYCKAGSPQALALKWIFDKGTKLNRATLEIQRVPGASPKQFEITGVVAEDWVVGETRFDEGFR